MVGGMRTLLPSGLRWRLTAWVAGVMIVSAAAVFVVVYKNTGSQLRGQIDHDLGGDTVQLAQAVKALRGRSAAQIAAAAARYIRSQPYSATSTILFAAAPGAPIATNHPEVFGSSQGDLGETTGDQAAESAAERRLLTPHDGYSTQRVPDIGSMRILERTVSLQGTTIVIGAGEPLALVERAERGIVRAFVLAGAIALAIVLLASYIAGAHVSAPLRRMASVATRVDAGDLAPRMDVPASSADEVRVLGDAFNRMLDRLSQAFATQREFIADASHELRTPLTVIRGQLEVLAAQEDPTAAEIRRVERVVQAEIARLSRLVDDVLVLARAEQQDFLRPEPVDVPSLVAELWDGLSRTAERRFELGPLPDGMLEADPDRLAQALRNLAGNAIEHTRERSGLVRLEVARFGGNMVRFTVVDDGPGIPASERERVFERFHRADHAHTRSPEGAGLGLAIVRAIAEAHGGEVRIVAPLDGEGARVELSLPGFRPR
jgi:two-component system, OmpR family, sensor kinase